MPANRVIIITGASRGIGAGLARHFGSLGARLVLGARKSPRLDELIAELSSAGVEAIGVVGDVADGETNRRLVAQAIGHFGRLDGVVANAQTFRPAMPLTEVTEADFDTLLDTGPKATLSLMQAAHPHMAAAGFGRIVTMGTAMGNTGAAGYGPYAASKEAIRSLTRTAANEWGRDGITVNCVCPASAAHRAPPAGDARAAAFAAMYDDHPMGRDGDPVTDIAPAVAFLLSEGSRYVTGQTLMVDGGGLMRA